MKFFVSKKLLVGLLLFVFSSQFYAQSVAELKSKITSINNVIAKAVMENDTEKMFSYYTDDAISLPSYEPMIKGLAALKAHGEKNKDAPYKMNEFTLTTSDVFPDGNLVIEVGKYTLTMEMQGVPEQIKDNGKYITIFQKQDDGSLKIKLDMWNTNLNPWMPKPKMAEKVKQMSGKYCSKCGHKNCSAKCDGGDKAFCVQCGKKDCKGKCMKEKVQMKKTKEMVE